MKCEKYINYYLKYGTGKSIPFPVRLHLKYCKRCAKEVAGLQKTFAFNENNLPYAMQKDLSASIMRTIQVLPHYSGQKVSGLKWVTTGLFMVGSIFLIPFSDSLQWMRGNFGESFDIPLTIVLGCVISVYITLFAASHFEALNLRDKITKVLK